MDLSTAGHIGRRLIDVDRNVIWQLCVESRGHVEDNVKNTRLDLRQPLSTKIAVRLHLESLQETGRVFWLET
jgi:hypothetical protein